MEVEMNMKDTVINRAIPDSERDEKQELWVCDFLFIPSSQRKSVLMKEELQFSWITLRLVILGKQIRLQYRDMYLFS